MSYNEAETRYYLIDPVLREKGYDSHQWLKLETPAPVEPTGPKGKRRKGSGRTDYLLCVQVGDMPKSLPVAVLEAKKETEDPLKGMQQAIWRQCPDSENGKEPERRTKRPYSHSHLPDVGT
jgi:type I restriction enzyme R subunit